MVVAGAAPSFTSFRASSIPSCSKKLSYPCHKYQSATLNLKFSRPNLRKVHLCLCLDPDKSETFSLYKNEVKESFLRWTNELQAKPSQNRKFICCASLEGSNNSTEDNVTVPPEQRSSLDLQGIVSDSVNVRNTGDAIYQCLENSGRSGIVSFFSVAPKAEQQTSEKAEQPVQTINDSWISLYWILGPLVLVSSVVLPPFFLRKVFEFLLEDSLVTDFLILFFTESLFYVGVFIFLLVAHKVQRATGIMTWSSGSRVSLGYKISSYATMVFAVILPLGSFAMVWPWTGPAAAAALLPYIAGLAVQYGFEHVVQERKWSVWPLIPIIFQVYRLHQLNRATQLVAGLLFSLRGAEATAETLAVNASLQNLVTVLQLLGMLCLWALAAYLTHVFSFEAQDWQSRVLS